MRIVKSLVVVAVMLLASGQQQLYAESLTPELLEREENYVRRLREAELFEIAEGYLTRKLGEPRLPHGLRTIYVVELARTFADHATTVSGPAQQIYWQQADEVLQKEIQAHAGESSILKVRVEQACLMAVKVEYYYKALELVTEPVQYQRQITGIGTSAITQLQGLYQELTEQINSKVEPGTTGIKLFQLQALELKTKFELARIHLNLASIDGGNEVEFAAHIIQAEKLLKQLTAGWTDEPQTQQAWVQLARLHRLNKDGRGFQVLRKALEPLVVPELIRDQIVAEEVRYLLQEGKLVDAEQMARERLHVKRDENSPAGELLVWHLRSLELLAELAESKGNKPLADDLRQQFQLRRNRFAQQADTYWSLRLKVQDQRHQSQLNKDPEFASLVQQAEVQFHSGDLKQAAASYYQLSQAALRKQNPKEGSAWGYTALSILTKQQMWEQIVKVASELYPQAKEYEQANEIHFLWILAEQQLLPKPWQKSPQMEAHVARLQEHLRLYGSESTASRVRLFLAMVGDQLGMNAAGVRRFYLQVDHEDGEFHKAIKLACRSLTQSMLNTPGLLPPEIIKEWEHDFTPVKNVIQQRPLSTESVETQLELIHCELLCSQPTNHALGEVRQLLVQLEQWLQNVQLAKPKANETAQSLEQIQQSAKLLLPEVLKLSCLLSFTQRDFEQVKQQMNQLGDLKESSLLQLLLSLKLVATRWGQERALRFQVSQVELLLLTKLDPVHNKLSLAEQEQVIDIKIEALSNTGQYAQARKLLEDELALHPERSLLAERLVVMYLENGSPQSLQEAAELVKKLESKQQAGTNEWLNYRLLLLETGIKQNKRDETKKLLQMTKILYPKAGSDEQKKKLLDLGEKLR